MHFLHACLTLELGLSNELNFLFVVVTFDRTRTGIGGERSKSRGFGRECVILALALHFKSTHWIKAALRLHHWEAWERWLIPVRLLLFVSILGNCSWGLNPEWALFSWGLRQSVGEVAAVSLRHAQNQLGMIKAGDWN
jgi:hypothetical protein